jgi:formate hydrogenlyase transcriptional activator
MPDPETKYRLLLDLCRIVQSSPDLRSLFQPAAQDLHEFTGCDRVRLVFAAREAPESPGFAMEFFGSAQSVEIPGQNRRSPAVEWVLAHRQARIVRIQAEAAPPAGEPELAEQGYQAVVYMPLVCWGEALGVLELAARQANQFDHCDLKDLEEMGGLLALALDNLAVRTRLADLQRFQRETAYLRDEIKADRDLRLLTGESPAMKAVRLAIQQVARTNSTVLVLGETGTGKELVARAIHQISPRRDRLLVAVNCAALAPGVIASELFGHEPGAFTGATRRRLGRFELANQGTIFLDEIGELSPEMQVLLLRVLQERVIERVGGNEPVAVDVRVIAATHQDLTSALNQGCFRPDLFFRLNVFPIRVPPLRERREDIPDLVRHFLHHLGRRMNKPITRASPAALRLLTEYHWPGNVRELENIMERAMIVATGDTLEVDPNWLTPAPDNRAAESSPAGLAETERRAILEALDRCRGRIYGPGGAAAALGLKPTTLYGKMRKHGIERSPASK